MKFFTLTKTLLLALCSTLVLVLVYVHTQGGVGVSALSSLRQALVPGGFVQVGGGADGADRADRTDTTNSLTPSNSPLNQGENKSGAVLGDSVSNSSNSSPSSRSSSTYNPTTPSIPSTLNPVPTPLNFSALGISEYELNSIIAQQLTNLASIGLLGPGQGSSSAAPSIPSTLNPSPSASAPAPVITYIQPAPSQNFSGASLLSATDLSSTRFTTTTANITDTATIKTLSVTENATVTGNLSVTGTITGSVSGTINPSFTLGSIPFQGASGLTQDNANLFWDDTNNRLGIGTTAPTEAFDLTGDLTTSRQLVIHNNYAVGAELYTHAAAGFRGPTISLMRSQGTQSAPTAVQSLDKLGYFQFFGHDGTAYQSGASIEVNTESAWSSGVTPAYMIFTTNGGTERMRITSAGNVGIGTTSPAQKLDVKGNIKLSDTSSASTIDTYYGGLYLGGTANDYSYGMEILSGTTRVFGYQSILLSFTDGTTDYTSRSTYDKKDIFSFGTDAVFGLSAAVNSPSSGSINLKKSRGTNTVPTAISSGDTLGQIDFSGYNNAFRVGATIKGVADTGTGATGADMPGALLFMTSPDGSATATERMRVTSAGNVGIGTSSPTETLSVNGSINIQGSSGYLAGSSSQGRLVVYGDREATNIGIRVEDTGSVILSPTAGNVGIGTTAPTQKLEISDNATNPRVLLSTTLTSDTYSGYQFNSGATFKGGLFRHVSNDDIQLWTAGDTNAPRINIQNGGRVKIGATPDGVGSITNGKVEIQGNGAVENTLALFDTQAAATDAGASISLGGYSSGSTAGARYAVIAGAKENGTAANTSGYLKFSTNDNGGVNSLTERLRITSTGNVGIGTTSPGALLDIQNSSGPVLQVLRTGFAGGALQLTAGSSYSSVGSAGSLQLNGTTNAIINGGFLFDPSNRAAFGGSAAIDSATTLYVKGRGTAGSSYSLKLADANDAVKMVVDDMGNVGIGTTSPASILDVRAATGLLKVTSTTGTNSAYLHLTNTGGDMYVGRELSTGDNLVTGGLPYAGVMTVNTAHALQFGTNNTVRMTVDSGGNVGIGTTSPGYQLEVRGTGAATDGLFINTAAYTSVPNPGSVSNKVILNPRGFNLATDATTLSSGYQPTFGVGIAVNRIEPAVAIKNGATYPAMVVESGYVGIGVSAPATSLDVHHPVELGGTTGNAVLILNNSGDGGTTDTNRYAHKQWLLRDATGTDWQTTRLHDAVSVGSSFGTPGTDTKTWWERDPNDNIQSWGNGASTYLTINAGNVGIGTTAPGKKFAINYNTVSTISSSDTNRPYWIYDYNNGGSVQWTSGYDVSGSNGFSITNIYSGTRDVFHIENAAPANAFRIISNTGNVGLGVTAPTAALSFPNTLGQKINLYDSVGGGMMGFGVGSSELQIGGYGSGAGQHTSLGHWSATSKTFVEQVRVAHDSGNVGLGTTAPTEKLQISSGNIQLDNGQYYKGKNTVGTVVNLIGNSSDNYIELGSATVGTVRVKSSAITFRDSGNTYDIAAISNSADQIRIGGGNQNYVDVYSHVTQIARFNSSGTYIVNSNVGIGTTTPADKLEVAGNIKIGSNVIYSADTGTSLNIATATWKSYNGNQSIVDSNGNTTIAVFNNLVANVPTLGSSGTIHVNNVQTQLITGGGGGGTAGQNLLVQGGDATTAPQYAGGNGGNLVLQSGKQTDNTLGNEGTRGYIAFKTYTSGNTPTLTERVRIDGAGNVGIGTTTPGYLLDVAGTGRFTGAITVASCTGCGGGSLSGLTAASATNDINNADYGQVWRWNSLSSGTGLLLSANTTAAASNTQKLLEVATTGTNATSSQTTYGGYFNNTHTGTGSKNIALYASATGAATNYAAILENGFVGMGPGATNPASQLVVSNAFSGSTFGNGTTADQGLSVINSYNFANKPYGVQFGGYSGYTHSGIYGVMTDSSGNTVGDIAFAFRPTTGTTNFSETVRFYKNADITIAGLDLGNGTAGPVITLGRNTNATNTGAGSINFQSKAGTAGYVWQDNAGNLRIHTSAPTNANDTAGTVIGTQTSTRDTKQDIQEYTDYAGALQAVINAPLRTFKYIKEVEGYGPSSPLAKNHIGFIADEVSGDFMQGNSIDQVSVNGLLMGSVKALDERIKNQELRIKELEIATSQSLLAMTEQQLWISSQNSNVHYAIVTKQLYLSQDSVGQAKILAGSTSVRITFSTPYEQQPIVTATATGESALVGDFRYAVVEKNATGFTIKLHAAQPQDLEFDWHAFASPEAKLTVSDGTTQQLLLVLPPSAAPEDGPLEEGRPLPGEVAGESVEGDGMQNDNDDDSDQQGGAGGENGGDNKNENDDDHDQLSGAEEKNENDPAPVASGSDAGQAAAQGENEQNANETGN